MIIGPSLAQEDGTITSPASTGSGIRWYMFVIVQYRQWHWALGCYLSLDYPTSCKGMVGTATHSRTNKAKWLDFYFRWHQKQVSSSFLVSHCYHGIISQFSKFYSLLYREGLYNKAFIISGSVSVKCFWSEWDTITKERILTLNLPGPDRSSLPGQSKRHKSSILKRADDHCWL